MRIRKSLRNQIDRLREALRIPLAYVWRRLMFRTTIIAITGSAGKTTAKDCLAAILETQAATIKTNQNNNTFIGITRAILSLRWHHKFLVVEVGTDSPGTIKQMARMIRPDIAIILNIKRDHTQSFATLEDTAKEKSQLLCYLKNTGTAVLNCDDPLVKDMAKDCHVPHVFFGASNEAQYQAQNVSADWPKRLSFIVKNLAESQKIDTQLVGSHWLSSVLAATSAAHLCGIPLHTASPAIATVSPYTGRMQPYRVSSGAIFIRDENNGSSASFEATLNVLKFANVKRRILIFSDMTQEKSSPKQRQRRVGKIAANHTQLAIFVSDHGHHAKKAALYEGMDPENCHHIMNLQQIITLLKAELREGDLVILKGRMLDHLSRIPLSLIGDTNCWKTTCPYKLTCDQCPELNANFNPMNIDANTGKERSAP